MKTYLTYDNQLRAETDPAIIATLERKGWLVTEPPVVEEVLPTYTAESWLDHEGYGGNRPTTLLYQKLRLDAAAKSSPKLDAVQSWLDAIIALGLAPASSHWPPAPHTFEATLAETLTALTAP